MATHDDANAFLKQLVRSYDSSTHGLGSTGVSLYDTAWLSIVTRTIDDAGTKSWVFPQSFEYICNAQAEDGGWHGDGSLIDSIMNTLVSLFSLKLHEKADSQSNLSDKVEKAKLFLTDALQKWDVPSTERIAFELIIPRVLQFLEDEGIYFEFPHREALENLRNRKLKTLDLGLVYRMQTPVLYTLEAFVGVLDFDRLGGLKIDGHFCASPASTAAYLTYCSTWDEEAENYLRQMLRRCSIYGEGAACTIWPTSVFELAWPIGTLIESGFGRDELDEPTLQRAAEILHSALAIGKGVTGPLLHAFPDADDTAKAVTALRYIGQPHPIEPLLKTFERPDYIMCQQFERNPSFSANCNVLIALQALPQPQDYFPQILKIINFVTGAYSSARHVEEVRDKWHTSPWYLAMLATKGFARFVHLYDKGVYQGVDVPEELITYTIPKTLFQFLADILQSQHKDGSWGSNPNIEETAYCVLALAHLTSLPYDITIRRKVAEVIGVAREYLKANADDSKLIKPRSQIWTSKVTYGLENICQGYALSALRVPVQVESSDSMLSSELAGYFTKASLE
ncbi:hypothetical protein VNI00_011224 [Paramarasmius palmivorus]|uniref:Uncharacterized protein n=1 Tax=Paramarasmius palmivorus TaxID=297713 RepID=A0AAW0CEL7_9AGAR